MTFLSPYYLFGLTALSVPLIIHLWSRRKPLVILFGSIRFIPSVDSSRTMSWVLTDKWLLLLRILLLTVIIIILARPAIEVADSDHLLLIDPLVMESEVVRELRDTTRENIRLLQTGFPQPEEASPSAEANTWALVSQASHEADSLTIITSNLQRNFLGKRPTLDIPVTWITVEPEVIKGEQEILSYSGKSGVQHHIVLHSAANSQRIERRSGAGVGHSPDTIHIQIIAGEDDRQVTYLDAAFTAVSDYLDIPVSLKLRDQILSPDDWNIDLSGELEPNGGNWLLARPAQPGPLILQTANPSVFHINGKLDMARLRKEDLPGSMLTLLNPFHSDTLTRADKLDIRFMSSPSVPNVTPKHEALSKVTALSTWPLWLLAAMLMIFERVYSYRKHG